MANPHHRKKHKEHLKQFQQKQNSFSKEGKGSAKNIFAIVGAVIGLSITYFATGNLVWVIVGALAGGLGGYFVGNNIDKAGKE